MSGTHSVRLSDDQLFRVGRPVYNLGAWVWFESEKAFLSLTPRSGKPLTCRAFV